MKTNKLRLDMNANSLTFHVVSPLPDGVEIIFYRNMGYLTLVKQGGFTIDDAAAVVGDVDTFEKAAQYFKNQFTGEQHVEN